MVLAIQSHASVKMADTQIKPEIKLDPAVSTPTDMADIEEYEDDHDLVIPQPPSEDGPQAWLVKVPKYIWKAWNDIYRNAPEDGGNVEIGKMRVYHAKDGEDPNKPRTQILLSPGVPQHLDLPKTYNVDIDTVGYSNHIVFSEKDLPGHQRNTYSRNKSRLSQLQKPRGIPLKSERYGTSSTTKPGTYRTAIPKQTALAPMIQHVADATPEQDKSYYDHFKKTYEAQTKPRSTVKYTAGIDRNLLKQSGASHLSAFTQTSRPTATLLSGRKPPPKEKAVRISQEALLDAIHKCFRRYKYWSLKALRNELRQPEAYIKSTLENVATLVRSGDFAMNYQLKPEFANIAEGVDVKEETAVVKSEEEESDVGVGVEESEMEMDGDDLEGDDVEFEDV